MSTRLPRLHALVACGAFTPEGDFLEVPEFDLDRLRAAWQEAVFALHLAEDQIELRRSIETVLRRAKTRSW